MITRQQKFLAFSASEKALLFCSWLLLGYTRAALLLCSFRRLAAPLEHYRGTIEAPPATIEQIHRSERIGYLVAVAANHTPWQSHCLVQVLVVQRLLARRGIPGQFYIGVRRGCELTGDPGALAAHAWLQCGDGIVNGAEGHDAFTILTTYRWGAGVRRPCQSAPN
jgi:hypothetical protein